MRSPPRACRHLDEEEAAAMEYYAHNPLPPPNPNNPNPTQNPIPYPYPYHFYPYNPTAYPPPPAAADSSASLPPPSGYEAYAYGGYVDQNRAAVSVAPVLSNAHLRQAVQLFGTDPAAAYQVAGAPGNGTAQTSVQNPTFHGKASLKKRKKNPTKVVASAYCEICSVDCSSVESLDQHKLGKKHKKKLEKLQEAANAAAGPSNNSALIEPPENPNPAAGHKTRRKAVQTAEDLEMKRRKVVEGGTAIEDVKTCSICNVVCNSEVVYKYHVAGQKHASMLKKKQAPAIGVPANLHTLQL